MATAITCISKGFVRMKYDKQVKWFVGSKAHGQYSPNAKYCY